MKIRIVVAAILYVNASSAQSIDSVLSSVEHNNLLLKANAQYWKSKNLEYRTGLTPYDPTVEFDYMYGSPVGAGNQRDFAVTQRFDFPTAYIKKRQLSKAQIAQSIWQYQNFRRDILLEAKTTALELIYNNRRMAELLQRLAASRMLVTDYQKKLDKGDATILEVNKAKLQLLTIQDDYVSINTTIKGLMTKLTELNGGKQLSFSDTTYPLTAAIPDFETLDRLIEENDPLLKVYQSNITLSKHQIGVQRAMSLPKPEVGYHSQGILGQSYKGVHVGTTIPLWENKNRVRTEKANLLYNELRVDAHTIEHRNENKKLYDLYLGKKEVLQEYEMVMASLNNRYLLNKALQLGQINILQYFFELSFYYTAYDKLLRLEYEYQVSIATLSKYNL
jgi:outer membrane protein TolC